MAIRVMDMFCGISAFRSAAEKIGGFEFVGYCECDPTAIAAYQTLYDTRGEYFCNDARAINTDELPDFDLLVGGFPCQSYSTAGLRKGLNDSRGTLFFELARLLEAKKPSYFLFENVSAILSFDNVQLTLFGGFAPNSSSADILSKALGNRTVMTGSVSRGRNDPSQSLQMTERPLMTPDELKSLPKGTFIVMKTGFHPMQVKLRLFFEWGITFEEPYTVEEKGNRKVHYADKEEIIDGIMAKYHADDYQTEEIPPVAMPADVPLTESAETTPSGESDSSEEKKPLPTAKLKNKPADEKGGDANGEA